MDTYHWNVFGCFIWDLFETSRRRTDGTSSLRSLETWSWHTNKTSWRRTTETSWRRSTETSLGVSFATYLTGTERYREMPLRFLATESPLKMMKNAFYLTSKALFVLKIFTFLSWIFGHVVGRPDKKVKVNFKFYDVGAFLTNNCNTYIVQYLQK